MIIPNSPAGGFVFHLYPPFSNAFPLSRLGAGWGIQRDCPYVRGRRVPGHAHPYSDRLAATDTQACEPVRVLLPLAETVSLKPLFGWHRHRLPQPFQRLRRFTDLHHLVPFEAREASAQLRRHGALPAVDDGPFGSPQCGYHALLSLCESYLLDTSRSGGSLGTRTPSFARVSSPMQGEPCGTASAARAYDPVAFPQEDCPSFCGLRRNPLSCL